MHHASGEFDVKVTPLELDGPVADPLCGRFALVKRYHGALDAAGNGQMLTAGTAVQGSAAYVAIEKVEGKLDGREGTFALAHLGTMSAAGQRMRIEIVPDSGTGALIGITGSLGITIAERKHFYDLAYDLPDHP